MPLKGTKVRMQEAVAAKRSPLPSHMKCASHTPSQSQGTLWKLSRISFLSRGKGRRKSKDLMLGGLVMAAPIRDPVRSPHFLEGRKRHMSGTCGCFGEGHFPFEVTNLF